MTEIQTVAVVVVAAIALTIAYYLGYAAGYERATKVGVAHIRRILYAAGATSHNIMGED